MTDLNLPLGLYETFFVPGPVSDTEGHLITINIVKASDSSWPGWLYPPTASTAWNEFGVVTLLAGALSLPMVI